MIILRNIYYDLHFLPISYCCFRNFPERESPNYKSTIKENSSTKIKMIEISWWKKISWELWAEVFTYTSKMAIQTELLDCFFEIFFTHWSLRTIESPMHTTEPNLKKRLFSKNKSLSVDALMEHTQLGEQEIKLRRIVRNCYFWHFLILVLPILQCVEKNARS